MTLNPTTDPRPVGTTWTQDGVTYRVAHIVIRSGVTYEVIELLTEKR